MWKEIGTGNDNLICIVGRGEASAGFRLWTPCMCVEDLNGRIAELR